jgi:rhodanese-related sulfurtransferase
MTAGDLKRKVERGEPIAVLDVREDEERTFCAIPLPPTVPDLHVPMGQVADRIDALRAVAETAPLVIYCHHGMRSMTVANWLSARGFADVHNLEGGIDAWSDIDPTVQRY